MDSIQPAVDVVGVEPELVGRVIADEQIVISAMNRRTRALDDVFLALTEIAAM
jgi:hypothetical protein